MFQSPPLPQKKIYKNVIDQTSKQRSFGSLTPKWKLENKTLETIGKFEKKMTVLNLAKRQSKMLMPNDDQKRVVCRLGRKFAWMNECKLGPTPRLAHPNAPQIINNLLKYPI